MAAVDYGAGSMADVSSCRADMLEMTSLSSAGSFLEAETAEYQAIALVPRENPSPSIPWPTIFPHAAPVAQQEAFRSDAQRAELQCDVLAHFIHLSDLESATRVLQELREHGIPIHNRFIYLHAALISLSTSAAGGQEKAEFLKWFELYPNRSANQHTIKAAETWDPITEQLIQSYIDDAAFLSDVLLLGAKKGLLPAFMPTLFKHFSTIAFPKDSLLLLERLLELYRKHTTSHDRQSTSLRAIRVRRFVERQCETFRGKHLHYLARAGWKLEAKMIFEARRGWDERTCEYLAKVFAEQPHPVEASEEDFELLPLARQIRVALQRPDITPVQLSMIQYALESRPSLLARFERRFTHPTTQRFRYRGQTWLHGMILSHAHCGKHEEALELFKRHFVWYGLPPLPLSPSSSQMQMQTHVKRRKTPSINVITSILPSILATLPKKLVQDYTKAYKALHPTLPPFLRPTGISHLALTVHSLRNPLNTTIEPNGTPAHSAVLCALAGQGDWPAVDEMLSRMEREGPEPNLRTYEGLIAVFVRVGEGEYAKDVLGRMRTRFGDEVSREVLGRLKVQQQEYA